MCANIAARLDAILLVNNEIAGLPEKDEIVVRAIQKWNTETKY